MQVMMIGATAKLPPSLSEPRQKVLQWYNTGTQSLTVVMVVVSRSVPHVLWEGFQILLEFLLVDKVGTRKAEGTDFLVAIGLEVDLVVESRQCVGANTETSILNR